MAIEQRFPCPTNAKIKPLDSSTRKLLIYKGTVCGSSGLRHFEGIGTGENNGKERAKSGVAGDNSAILEVHKTPHQPAPVRAIPQTKTPTESRWRWCIGGAASLTYGAIILVNADFS
jgi:hypothetical protein